MCAGTVKSQDGSKALEFDVETEHYSCGFVAKPKLN